MALLPLMGKRLEADGANKIISTPTIYGQETKAQPLPTSPEFPEVALGDNEHTLCLAMW